MSSLRKQMWSFFRVLVGSGTLATLSLSVFLFLFNLNADYVDSNQRHARPQSCAVKLPTGTATCSASLVSNYSCPVVPVLSHSASDVWLSLIKGTSSTAPVGPAMAFTFAVPTLLLLLQVLVHDLATLVGVRHRILREDQVPPLLQLPSRFIRARKRKLVRMVRRVQAWAYGSEFEEALARAAAEYATGGGGNGGGGGVGGGNAGRDAEYDVLHVPLSLPPGERSWVLRVPAVIVGAAITLAYGMFALVTSALILPVLLLLQVALMVFYTARAPVAFCLFNVRRLVVILIFLSASLLVRTVLSAFPATHVPLIVSPADLGTDPTFGAPCECSCVYNLQLSKAAQLVLQLGIVIAKSLSLLGLARMAERQSALLSVVYHLPFAVAQKVGPDDPAGEVFDNPAINDPNFDYASLFLSVTLERYSRQHGLSNAQAGGDVEVASSAHKEEPLLPKP